ncbi:Armadillo repeat-containing protein 6 [Gracilariopsis chorda]|uniref:Armadillo repeat-containing protein 6 n=1 Tax=Gracilariopsis chorda TaxID=448386 RepID=A0A2V3J078_9FLOR|nr:Armadillo repeat-containing protein 6 [Gracilariopsis chorda]|eukprot:PXF46760.1 Armadillo repeat-containing protein 6 [Gracilariopsis chorda]
MDEGVEVVFCRKNSSWRRPGPQQPHNMCETQASTSTQMENKPPTKTLAQSDNGDLNQFAENQKHTQASTECTGEANDCLQGTHISVTTAEDENVSSANWIQPDCKQEPETESEVREAGIPTQAPLTSIVTQADAETIVSELSALSPEDLDAFRKHGGPPNCETIVAQVIESLESDVDDTRTLRSGISSLLNLCSDRDSRTCIGVSGGIKAAIEVMRQNREDIAIQELGMRFLEEVCSSHFENKLQVGQRGGMQVILRNIRRGSNLTAGLFEGCCGALRSLCYECEFNQLLAASQRAAPLLADGLARWRNDVHALEECLHALYTLASKNTQNASMIRESGACATIVSVMEQYAAYLNIQTACLEVAQEVLIRNTASREDMGAAGFVEAIEGGLLKHTMAKKFIVLSCSCLRYLAFTSANRQRIAECAIMPLLTASLERWNKCVDVVVSILPAFANATYDNRRNKYAAARNGGVATLVSLFDIHESCSSICEYTCKVLRNVSDGTIQTKRQCVRQDGILGVTRAMKYHLQVEGVQEHGCAMLINLFDGFNHLIKEYQMEEHLCKVLEMHQGVARVEQQAMHLQATLARMPTPEGTKQNSVRSGWLGWFGRNRDSDESSGTLTRAASSWWFSTSRENQLAHRESISSRGSTALRVGEITLDAEDILNGEEIDKAVARLSTADSAVEY